MSSSSVDSPSSSSHHQHRHPSTRVEVLKPLLNQLTTSLQTQFRSLSRNEEKMKRQVENHKNVMQHRIWKLKAGEMMRTGGSSSNNNSKPGAKSSSSQLDNWHTKEDLRNYLTAMSLLGDTSKQLGESPNYNINSGGGGGGAKSSSSSSIGRTFTKSKNSFFDTISHIRDNLHDLHSKHVALYRKRCAKLGVKEESKKGKWLWNEMMKYKRGGVAGGEIVEEEDGSGNAGGASSTTRDNNITSRLSAKRSGRVLDSQRRQQQQQGESDEADEEKEFSSSTYEPDLTSTDKEFLTKLVQSTDDTNEDDPDDLLSSPDLTKHGLRINNTSTTGIPLMQPLSTHHFGVPIPNRKIGSSLVQPRVYETITKEEKEQEEREEEQERKKREEEEERRKRSVMEEERRRREEKNRLGGGGAATAPKSSPSGANSTTLSITIDTSSSKRSSLTGSLNLLNASSSNKLPPPSSTSALKLKQAMSVITQSQYDKAVVEQQSQLLQQQQQQQHQKHPSQCTTSKSIGLTEEEFVSEANRIMSLVLAANQSAFNGGGNGGEGEMNDVGDSKQQAKITSPMTGGRSIRGVVSTPIAAGATSSSNTRPIHEQITHWNDQTPRGPLRDDEEGDGSSLLKHPSETGQISSYRAAYQSRVNAAAAVASSPSSASEARKKKSSSSSSSSPSINTHLDDAENAASAALESFSLTQAPTRLRRERILMPLRSVDSPSTVFAGIETRPGSTLMSYEQLHQSNLHMLEEQKRRADEALLAQANAVENKTKGVAAMRNGGVVGTSGTNTITSTAADAVAQLISDMKSHVRMKEDEVRERLAKRKKRRDELNAALKKGRKKKENGDEKENDEEDEEEEEESKQQPLHSSSSASQLDTKSSPRPSTIHRPASALHHNSNTFTYSSRSDPLLSSTASSGSILKIPQPSASLKSFTMTGSGKSNGGADYVHLSSAMIVPKWTDVTMIKDYAAMVPGYVSPAVQAAQLAQQQQQERAAAQALLQGPQVTVVNGIDEDGFPQTTITTRMENGEVNVRVVKGTAAAAHAASVQGNSSSLTSGIHTPSLSTPSPNGSRHGSSTISNEKLTAKLARKALDAQLLQQIDPVIFDSPSLRRLELNRLRTEALIPSPVISGPSIFQAQKYESLKSSYANFIERTTDVAGKRRGAVGVQKVQPVNGRKKENAVTVTGVAPPKLMRQVSTVN